MKYLLAILLLAGCASKPETYREAYERCYAEKHADLGEKLPYHIQWYPDEDCKVLARKQAPAPRYDSRMRCASAMGVTSCGY